MPNRAARIRGRRYLDVHPLARMYARRALEIARTAGQLWPLAYVRFITSVYGMGAARWEEGEEALGEAEGLFERLGDTWSVQGLLGLCRGQFVLLGAAFTKLYDHGVRNANVQHQVWACLGKAECELRTGRTGEAVRLLETALALLAEHPDRAEQVRAYGLLAAVHLRRGETAAARAAAASGASLIAQFKIATSFYLLEGYAGVAEVHLHQWEAGDRSRATKQAAQQACSALRRYAHIFPVAEPRARLLSGRLLYLSGRQRRARAAWRASLSVAERLGMPFEAALTHSALGRHGAGEAQSRQHLESAQTLLQELGLPHEPTHCSDLAPE